LHKMCKCIVKKHPSPGNYAQVAIRQLYDDNTFSKRDVSDIYEGFDDVDGENSTHSEQYAHQWVIDTISIYQKRANWIHVKSLTVVFYSQVQVCKSCRIDMRSWPNTYQKSAGAAEAQLLATEEALGFPLPLLLRTLYAQVANGKMGKCFSSWRNEE